MSTDDDYPTDVTDEPWEVLPPLLPERTWRPSGPGPATSDTSRAPTVGSGTASASRTSGGLSPHRRH
jgi:hypothetical protein